MRFPRGCRGPRAWHAVREVPGTWETLIPPRRNSRGKAVQPKESCLKGVRESDHLIVLRDGKADHMGKGMTVLRSPQRKHVQTRRAEQHMQTSLRGIAKRTMFLYEASNTEEPCAGKPHAGICERAVG